MSQYFSQLSFLLVITIISIVFGLKAVVAAQVSQAVDAVFSGVFFYFSWKLMEEVPARHVLQEGKLLLSEGFVQVTRTVRDINRSYKKGTRWFFLAVTCAEAGANAFTVVAVVFLAEELGFSSLGIGIFFIVSLVFSIPGSFLGAYVTRKLDPKRSWRLVMILLFFWTSIGAIVLEFLPKKFVLSQFCVGERDRPLPWVVLPCGESVLLHVLAQGSRSGTFWLFRLLLPDSGLVASSAILHHGRNQGRTDLWSGRCEWLLPSCRRYRFLCCPLARSLGGLWTGSSRNGNRISPGQFATRITGCSIGKYPT